MALPMALRARVIEAYEAGEGSIRSLATRFKVGKNTVRLWLKRQREEGHYHAKCKGSGPRFRVEIKERRRVLQALVEETPDATLAEFARRFEEETGHAISPSGVRTELVKMDYTRKKRPYEPASKTSSVSRSASPSSKTRSHVWMKTSSSSSTSQGST